METSTLKQQLREKIRGNLIPLIDEDYLYLELPYHYNLGDILIAEGTKDFLKNVSHKCIMASGMGIRDYREYTKRSPNAIILIHGGGNFGDVWPGPHSYTKKVISDLPDHKIIILPQSIHYQNQNNLDADIDLFSQHPNVIICAREEQSYNHALEYFPNNQVLLVPDMAFAIDFDKYKFKIQKNDKSLFLLRGDHELRNDVDYKGVPQDADMLDWPTMAKKPKCTWLEYQLLRIGSWHDKIFKGNQYGMMTDYIWNNLRHPRLTKLAIKFLSKYEHIYTTRMHAMVLAFMMGHEHIEAFDNSYGKISSLYDTWLSDVDTITIHR